MILEILGVILLLDDVSNSKDFDINNILIDEKSHENILIDDISYEILNGSEPLHIRFNKIGGFIKTFDETRYLTLLGPEKNDAPYDRIWYSIRLKVASHIFFFHYFPKISWFLSFFIYRREIDFA